MKKDLTINKRNKSDAFLNVSLTFILLFVFTFSGFSQDLENLKTQKPFAVSGNVEAGLNYYHTSDSTQRMMPLQWMVGGNVNFAIYGFNVPISIALSSQNRNFKVPFNRIGLSPYYKWAKLHLGWRSLNFNSYTLGGQQINGAGFELTPGKFHVAFMYGRLNNAITNVSVFNNLNNNQPIYNRNAYAFKIGAGGKKSNISLSILRAGDNLKTANEEIKELSNTPGVSNLAIGLNGKVTFLKHFQFKAEGATSVYTRNVEADSFDLPAKVNNNFFIKSGFVPEINFSTTLGFAANSSLAYSNKGITIAAQYVRVDPDYKSLGAFFMETDVEQYSLAPSFMLWKGRVMFSGNFGYQRNNLYKQHSNDSKRLIGMANLTINPKPTYGFSVQYSNYGISQQVLTNYQNPANHPTFYDSIRISQVSQSISFNTHLNIIQEKINNIVSFNLNIQNLKDHNDLNMGMGNFTSVTGNLNHNLLFNELDFDINQNILYINTMTQINSIGSAGYALTLTKGFYFNRQPDNLNSTSLQKQQSKTPELRLNVSLSGNYYANILDANLEGHTIGTYGGIGFIIANKHTINFNIGLLNNLFKTPDGNGKRDDLTGMIRYGFRF